MISKKLFINLLKDDAKKRSWLWILSLLYFCLVLPGMALDSMQAQSEFANGETARAFYLSVLSQNKQQIPALLGVGGFAVICALSGFSYLHSRSKLDFYHSLPIKRSMFLTVQYASSFLIFFIPAMLGLGEELLLGIAFGVSDGEVFFAAVGTGAVYSLIFCFLYLLSVTAIMMTGKLLVSALAIAALFGASSLVAWIYEMFQTTFFKTYYLQREKQEFLQYPSPYTLVREMIERWGDYVENGFREGFPGGLLAVLILLSLLLSLINAILYRKRKTEAAGRAIAFEKTSGLIEFVVVVIASLGVGIYLKMFSYTQSDLWFFGGIVAGGLIFTALMDFIYSMDIKTILKKPIQTILTLGTAVAIALIFQRDLLGYDTYLPPKDRISSMSVANYALSNVYQQIQYLSEQESSSFVAMGDREVLDSYQMTEFEDIYRLAENGWYHAFEEEPENDSRNVSVDIRYNLNNGRKVYRTYWVDQEVFSECAERLYKKPGFKRAMYPIFRKDSGNIRALAANGLDMGSGYYYFDSESQKELFLETYTEELITLQYNEISGEDILGNLVISYEETETDTENGTWISREDSGYPVLGRFTNTLKILEEMGIVFEEHLDPDEIYGIELWTEQYENMINLLSVEPGVPDLITAEEKEELVGMLTYHYCVSSDYSGESYFVIVYGENGEYIQNFQVPKKEFPDSLQKVLNDYESRKSEKPILVDG